MAELSEYYVQFLVTLSEEEQRKYMAYYEDDVRTKDACENAGIEWDAETESTAVLYLKNLKRRKDLARTYNQLYAPTPVTTGGCPDSTVKRVSTSPQGQRIGSATGDIFKVNYSRKKRANDSDADNESVKTDATTDGELSDSDCESYEVCWSVTSRKKNPEVQTKNGTSETPLIKKFPISAFRDASIIDQGGLYSHVSLGYIHDRRVKLKSFHTPLKRIEPICWKTDSIRKIFQLKHRNLIPMLGMIDVGLNECPQLVYASEPGEVSLLQYLRDKGNRKDYATFRKMSLDIIDACEYLHKNGIVHGFLSSSTVTIRKASRFYDYVNSFLTDYGTIQLTDANEKRNFYKTRDGKMVHLRWVPKEILTKSSNTAIKNCLYTFESDVWSFGVVLWEMWTDGDVPYGKEKSNPKVEKEILKGCHPLSFNTPSKCPQDIVEEMFRIFAPASERPTFSELKERFVEFREYRNTKRENNSAKIELIGNPGQKSQTFEENKQPISSSSKIHKSPPPAYSRYPRVQQWKDQHDGRKISQVSKSVASFNNSRFNGKARKRGGCTLANTCIDSKKCRGENINPPEVGVVYLPIMSSIDTTGMSGVMAGFQNQVGLAHALAAFSAATRYNSGGAGTNNVNVNIGTQRCSGECTCKNKN